MPRLWGFLSSKPYPLQVNPTRLKHGRGTTCSRRCSYSLRGQAKTTSIIGLCGVCGKEVARTPSRRERSKTTAFLCSPTCAYQARSKGLVGREVTHPYVISLSTRQASADRRIAQNARRKAEGRYAQTEETKAKLSQSTARAIAEGAYSESVGT